MSDELFPSVHPSIPANLVPSHNKLKITPRDSEFFIPIHGFVKFTDDEIRIINHPSVQRLGYILQLGQAYLVYRGATHTRLEHVLGTVHTAQKIIDAVEENHERARRSGKESDSDYCVLCDSFNDNETAFIRLAALLHDIGHLPYGHSLEDELKILPKHDEMERLKTVFSISDWGSGNREKLEDLVDEVYSKYINNKSIKPTSVLLAIIAKDFNNTGENKLNTTHQDIRIDACRDVVGNTICADILDYIYRDWYHIGKPKYPDSRLYQYMQIRKDDSEKDKFLISLGKSDRPRYDAITEIIDLLEDRYQLCEAVIFHRTKCSAAAMLERAMIEIYKASARGESSGLEWTKHMEINLLKLKDHEVLGYLKTLAAKYKCNYASSIIDDLDNRKIYCEVRTLYYNENRNRCDSLQKLLTESEDASEVRLRLVEELELDFKLPAGSIVIYCPAKKMNAKIAAVNLHYKNSIAPFIDWNPKDAMLGGDHLRAQVNRFRELWRIHICIKRDIWNTIKGTAEAKVLKEIIDKLVLGLGENKTNEAKDLAKQLHQLKLSRFSECELKDQPIAANSRKGVLAKYPGSGAPCIRNFYGEKGIQL